MKTPEAGEVAYELFCEIELQMHEKLGVSWDALPSITGNWDLADHIRVGMTEEDVKAEASDIIGMIIEYLSRYKIPCRNLKQGWEDRYA